MKKDIALALVVIAAVAALCFFLAKRRPPAPTPVAAATQAAPAKEAGGDKVVLRINGRPVTEAEFMTALRQVPEEEQRQLPNARAFAEQYVRLKLLAEEGERLGIDRDPRVKAQLSSMHDSVIASATVQKLAEAPSDATVKAYYDQHKEQYESVDVSHIVIGYQGSAFQPRNGPAPTEEAAAQRALEIVRRARGGADFAQLARENSDDPNSAAGGGKLGPVSKGMLPPEIEAQVFRLKPGEVSGPVPSRYGIHIFKAGARTVEPLEKMKPLVAQQLQQKTAQERIDSLRKAAKVDFDPKFFPEPKRAPGPK